MSGMGRAVWKHRWASAAGILCYSGVYTTAGCGGGEWKQRAGDGMAGASSPGRENFRLGTQTIRVA